MRRASSVVVAALMLCAPNQAEAWGFTAHRMVNRKAIGTLPPPLRALFERNAAYLIEHSIDPDLQRSGPSDPDHFLDMDSFGEYPFPTISHVESEHLAKFGKDAAAKGRVPWKVGETYRELVAAFRAQDLPGALERAAALGHYVGDAHVPLHSATNYDGQTSGQTGLHGRWESVMVERFERQIDAATKPAAAGPVGDPVNLTFEILLESYSAYSPQLKADLETRGDKDLAETPQDDRYGDAYYSKLFEREGAVLMGRMTKAAQRVGSLWLKAWEEAGRPALDPQFRVAYVRRQAKAILVSLDGASSPVIDNAVARGVMPTLEKLRREGAIARALTTPIAKTASGHAALFTGTWGDRSGITGNSLPLPASSVLEWNTGYTSTALSAEPLWVTAARQGLEVTAVSAPQVYPFGPFLQERRFGANFGRSLTLLDGYQNLETPDRVLTAKDLPLREPEGWLGPLPKHEGDARELQITIGGVRVDGLLYDDPGDPAHGFDTLYLALDKDPAGGVTLKPAAAKGADAAAFAGLTLRVAGGETAAYFRLFALAPDAKEILLYQAGPHVIRSSRARVDVAAFEATGGFVGNGASRLYTNGALGATLAQGGDGTAERRYLETVALVVRQLTRLTDFSIDRTAWDILLTYLPYPDESFHVWLGLLDESLPGHDAALAARVRPFMDEVLRLCDGFLARLQERAPRETILAVAADHGQVGTNRSFRANRALRDAGLLTVRDDGSLDLARTKAVVPSGSPVTVLINRVSRSGGIVQPQDEAAVRSAVKDALLSARDPETGTGVVSKVWDGSEPDAPSGAFGPHGGDLYFEVRAGYLPSGAIAGTLAAPEAAAGEHFGNAGLAGMHAAFAISGPGVARGVDLGEIRQIDVAPTLCALLGLEPPANATGRVIEGALARKR